MYVKAKVMNNEIDENEVNEFEKGFIPKEKGYSKTQDRFNELVNEYYNTERARDRSGNTFLRPRKRP